MATPPLVTYWHRQSAPLCLLLYALGILFLGLGLSLRQHPVVCFVLALAGSFLLLLAPAFHHLTVADEGNVLAVRFGPLPLFRTAIRYDDIRRIEIDRTSVLDGWGIHLSLRGGWVWNLWGRDCVALHLRRGGVFRLGSDEVESLARFIQTRIEDFEEAERHSK